MHKHTAVVSNKQPAHACGQRYAPFAVCRRKPFPRFCVARVVAANGGWWWYGHSSFTKPPCTTAPPPQCAVQRAHVHHSLLPLPLLVQSSPSILCFISSFDMAALRAIRVAAGGSGSQPKWADHCGGKATPLLPAAAAAGAAAFRCSPLEPWEPVHAVFFTLEELVWLQPSPSLQAPVWRVLARGGGQRGGALDATQG